MPTLTDIAMGYFRSRAVCAAARLGVADALGDCELAVEEIAARCGAHAGALYRLMRALASFGVVAERSPGRFALTTLGAGLRKDAPGSEWASVVFWADLLADSWSYLTECVRTGDAAAKVRPAGGPSRWAQDPNAMAIFRGVMGTPPAEDFLPIARAWDFSPYGAVADLGGGGGGLLAAILEAYPNLRGTLVDRQEAVDAAAGRFAGDGLRDRSTLLGGDLLVSVPAGCDVYVLKHVLHGYADDGAVEILEKCAAVLPDSGRVLAIEFVLPDVVDRADPALEYRLMSDLNMMAVTGGKERNEMEWKALLGRAGLAFQRIIPVAGDLVSIVEAARA
jgi:O-methyltransferase domain/Dimerisation domain